MSLLKWQERAKRKSELGNKINFVHDTILKIIQEKRPVRNCWQRYLNQ